jgi:hypothetical protein
MAQGAASPATLLSLWTGAGLRVPAAASRIPPSISSREVPLRFRKLSAHIKPFRPHVTVMRKVSGEPHAP